MSTADHIDCFLLSVLLHLLGMLLIVIACVHAIQALDVAPKIEAADIELTLISDESDNASNLDAGQAAAKSPEPGAPQPPPSLQPPQPAEPVPLPNLPEKPSFAEALTPAPEEPTADLKPEPTAVPVPVPASPSRPVSVTPPTTSAEKTTQHPTAASAAGDSSLQPTLQPAGGGGGFLDRIDAYPSVERAIKPNYPIGARRRGEEGTVVLDVTVTPEGQAREVKLVASCGSAELDDAAQRAVDQARFRPGTRNGRPVESAARLTIIFRLRDQ